MEYYELDAGACKCCVRGSQIICTNWESIKFGEYVDIIGAYTIGGSHAIASTVSSPSSAIGCTEMWETFWKSMGYCLPKILCSTQGWVVCQVCLQGDWLNLPTRRLAQSRQ